LVFFEVGLVEHGLAAGAFDPQAFGHLSAISRVGVLNFWGKQFFKPTHEGSPSGADYR
jgi:hypothetical protein